MFFESFWLNCTVSIGLIVTLTFDYVTKFFSYWYVRHIPYKTSIPFFGGDYHRVLGIRSTSEEVNHLYKLHPKESLVGSVKSRIPDLTVKSPDLIKEVLSTYFENFKSRGVDLDKSRDVCLRNNLFYAEGEKWTLLRERFGSLLNSLKFSEDDFLECLSGTNGDVNVQDILSQVLDTVLNNLTIKESTENTIKKLRKTAQKRSVLDRYKSYLKSIFPSLYTLYGLKTLPGQPSKDVKMALQRSIFSKTIESTFEENNHKKVLKSNSGDVAFGILSTFITEGYMPCLNVLTALFYNIAKNPEAQKIAKDSPKYLDAAIQETLRMHPPYSVITRKCVKTFKFSESKVLVDRGVTINIPVEALHRDNAYYKDADVFKPERFLDASTLSYTFLPFGAGPRKCIGEELSMEIIRRVSSSILKKFKVDIAVGKTPSQLTMVDYNFARVIDKDVWLNFKPVQNT